MTRWWVVAFCLLFFLAGDIVGRLGGVEESPIAMAVALGVGLLAIFVADRVAEDRR